MSLFLDFGCGVGSFVVYEDTRMGERHGDPIQSSDVAIVKLLMRGRNRSLIRVHPRTKIGFWAEDYDASLGPSDKDRGFFIRDDVRTKAFLPDSSCEAMPYGKSGCAVFCEDVCLRLVHLQPTGQSSSSGYKKLSLTNQNGISKQYSIEDNGKAMLSLPSGQYFADFLDEDENSILVDSVSVSPFRRPHCENYVNASDFSFNHPAPSASPTDSPTVYNENYYVSAGENKKCPYGDTRLFRYEEISSVEDCHQECFNLPGCNYFTFEADSNFCMGCNLNDVNQLTSEKRYDLYKLSVIKQYSGYELANDGSGENMKCPSNNDCIFRTSSRIEFTISARTHPTVISLRAVKTTARKSMLYNLDSVLESHTTFNTYVISP
jgi:hypothetical protein